MGWSGHCAFIVAVKVNNESKRIRRGEFMADRRRMQKVNQ
jgi:hypothetical protein